MSRRHNDEQLGVFQKGLSVSSFRGLIAPEELVKIRTTPVMWGIPCDELGYSKFWINFEKASDKMPWDDFGASLGTYLPKARNFVHKKYRKESSAQFLMMLDSDILFPLHIVDRLLSHKVPIIGGWYRDKKAVDHHPVIYDFIEDDKDGIAHWKHRTQPGTGLEKVDGMGAGCWLMRRDVADILGDEPYDMRLGGEDLALSRRLMKLGIPLYVDWSINCAHAGVGFW